MLRLDQEKGAKLTDEGLATFGDDVPKMKAFAEPYFKAVAEMEAEEEREKEEK